MAWYSLYGQEWYGQDLGFLKIDSLESIVKEGSGAGPSIRPVKAVAPGHNPNSIDIAVLM